MPADGHGESVHCFSHSEVWRRSCEDCLKEALRSDSEFKCDLWSFESSPSKPLKLLIADRMKLIPNQSPLNHFLDARRCRLPLLIVIEVLSLPLPTIIDASRDFKQDPASEVYSTQELSAATEPLVLHHKKFKREQPDQVKYCNF